MTKRLEETRACLAAIHKICNKNMGVSKAYFGCKVSVQEFKHMNNNYQSYFLIKISTKNMFFSSEAEVILKKLF